MPHAELARTMDDMKEMNIKSLAVAAVAVSAIAVGAIINNVGTSGADKQDSALAIYDDLGNEVGSYDLGGANADSVPTWDLEV
ncbi:hypothetical protein CKF53_00730 [Corynebacterium striatum]|uniref:Secreted protein n=2 Tax=Corynebacterium striatum TaxID=43770 RepID=A0ABC8CK65_CORST|nr:hypothetical protein BBR43_10955 [Corynebacterium striatum]OFT59947.1 hypothetical protein HMPREF3148_12655 [Corynebacterium sp. HMSC05D08]ATZ08967.1 hypothetical protein A9D01_09635 [Corynebacterium striatum]PIS67672.1 hypothetical protein AZH46_08665 [Corynebacterium striatum]PXY09074.1 hypothetical protein CKF53_00730 [Corynebacterium striatum]